MKKVSSLLFLAFVFVSCGGEEVPPPAPPVLDPFLGYWASLPVRVEVSGTVAESTTYWWFDKDTYGTGVAIQMKYSTLHRDGNVYPGLVAEPFLFGTGEYGETEIVPLSPSDDNFKYNIRPQFTETSIMEWRPLLGPVTETFFRVYEGTLNTLGENLTVEQGRNAFKEAKGKLDKHFIGSKE